MSTNARNQPKVMSSVLVYPDPSLLDDGQDPHEPEVFPLEDDCSVILGHDETCRIRLAGPSVASKHTMLRMVEGVVFASDWFSESGTLLNGQPIQDTVEIGMMDQLEIGGCRVRVVVHPVHENRESIEDFPEIDQPSNNSAATQDSFDEFESASEASNIDEDLLAMAGAESETHLFDSDPTEWEKIEPEADHLHLGNETKTEDTLNNEGALSDATFGDASPIANEEYSVDSLGDDGFAGDHLGDEAFGQPSFEQAPSSLPGQATASNVYEQNAFDAPASDTSLADDDSSQLRQQLDAAQLEIEQLHKELEYQRSLQDVSDSGIGVETDEENALLREEVLHLQGELAQREQELEEMAEHGGVSETTEPTETAKLVERLEDLLDELQTADQRVLNLEDLLRASDEAYQSEMENHRQIEEWITQLEKQVSERDEEWLAREQQLRKQLDESVEARKNIETRLTQTRSQPDNQPSPAVAQLETQVDQLGAQVKDLSQQLESAKAANQRMNQLLAKAGSNEQELAQIGQLKQKLRENELELSEKRAELGRQKAELSKMRDELADMAAQFQPAEIDDENLKLREFRKHLQEIHEQDKQEKQERSLSTRISRLWNRLDRR